MTTINAPRSFDLTYLEELIKRDNSELIGKYPKLNGGINILFICNCKRTAEKIFRDISYYGGAFCKECTQINRVRKLKETCMRTYGVSNPSQIEEIKKKKEQTYMEHYGTHPKRTKEVNDKYIQTCLDKYGCVNVSQAAEIKEKIKNTFNINYGGHPMLNEKIKNKVKETCFEKYGGYPAESQEVKDKIFNTCINKYGGYPTQSSDIMEKIRKNNLIKYGCHPSQTSEIMNKIACSSKSYKKYTMPSGKIRNIQGYEPFALDILLKEYNEEQIETDRNKVPQIKYIINDNTKIYFPDIYIPTMNLIIEVKSQWIYNKQLEINKKKEEATLQQGYKYEVWMFNNKGIRIN